MLSAVALALPPLASVTVRRALKMPAVL